MGHIKFQVAPLKTKERVKPSQDDGRKHNAPKTTEPSNSVTQTLPNTKSANRRRLTQQQLETHLWGAANILRGKTAGQDYKNYILSLIFYKRLCDQWENEADALDLRARLELLASRTGVEPVSPP
ncbi:MAG: type I restriction-modification system subunit M N-terminal domain-containing protein [Pyrinomonadaceae bacterium]|nr:type I restriction-modification system subunit M N-terminal domain-containing protein [Pyrinomonadaceae bacterium]